jgi:hypothetical protein
MEVREFYTQEPGGGRRQRVVVQVEREAIRTRDYCVAKNATLCAARPDPSLRKERLLRMTNKLRHYLRRLANVALLGPVPGFG